MAMNLKDIAKKMSKDAIKTKIKAAVMKATLAVAVVLVKFLPLIILSVLVGSVLLNFQKEIIQAKTTPNVINDTLEIEDFGELIEIKGNDTEGYYWGFKDDADTKLDEVIEELKDNHSTVSIPSKDLLKKMILAQVVTQYPDLGGKSFGSTSSNSYGVGNNAVCDLVLSQLGTPYVVGGESLEEGGFDCSGLIVWAFQEAGYDWGGERKTANGFSQIGRQITREELQPGDLICEGWDGSKYGHIVVYIGNNQVVGAEAVCSLAWNKHTVGACENGCCVRKREMTDEELNGTNTKYITLADYYTGSDNVYSGSSNNSDFVTNFLNAAQEITDYVKANNFQYGHAEYMPPKEDGTTNNDGSKHISCDRLVSWALYKCGYTDQPQYGLCTTVNDSPLMQYCEEKGWLRIDNVNEVQAGDIVFSGATNSTKTTAAHTFICAGDNKRYDCGSVDRIQLINGYSSYSSQPFNEPITNFVCAYRVTTGYVGNSSTVGISEDNNSFQGAIHLRRVTPNKEVGELKDVSTGVTTQKGTYVQANSVGLGTKEDISESIKEKMRGKSMPDGASISYDDLSYLTIPYYDFDGKVQKGNMIVRKELADEVLLIFQELYNIKYPIYKMQLIDNYNGTGEDLDWNSIEANNTSAFCYRNSVGGDTISNHGLGQAIDINPLINPYIAKEGEKSSHDVSNECNYISRNVSTWKDETDKWSLEIAKEAEIDTDTEIYKIFKKYGWTWGGDWNSPKDYQHFEKEDLTDVAHITSKIVEDTNDNESKDNDSDEMIAGDGKEYVIAIDAGHGPSEGANLGYYKTGTSDSSGLNTGMVEWEETRKVADAVADKLSIYSNLKIVRIGNSAENEMVKNSDRVNMAKELGADLYITIHYNGSDDKSVSGTEVYYPLEQGQPDDTVSMQLAQILSETVSNSIGIQNRGIYSEYHASSSGLVIIKHSNLVGFPCVCIEGGYMSNQTDVNQLKGSEGVERYANGIAAGILEYCGLENKGYGQVGSYSGSLTNNAGIQSKIFDLKYVSKELFKQHVNEGNVQALREFTIDEDDSNKIIIATWSNRDGITTISEKIIEPSKTYTQKYTMPIEYLLAYYIDTRNEEFVTELAKLAYDSEFVLAVQDNVTTTLTEVFQAVNVEVNRRKIENHAVVGSWENIKRENGPDKKQSSELIENVSTSVELTYGDTWFVKFYKDINYSSGDLSPYNVSNRVNTVQTINGNVNKSNLAYKSSSKNYNYERHKNDEGDGYVDYTITTTITTTKVNTISYGYNTGQMNVLGNEQKFITLYKSNEDFRTSLKPEWLFRILEKQSSEFLDLTKYLLYLARNQKDDYGVEKFDFSVYNPENFTSINGIYGNTVEEKVWFAFRSAGYSEEATAGVMGNMYQESSFIPYNANAAKGLEWSKQYIENVDNGTISREEFIRDGQGFGLGGFTYSKLKGQIYDYAKSKNTSIGDANTQIEMLLGWVNPEGGADGYATYMMDQPMNGCSREAWMSAGTPEEAAYQFCWIYEKCNPGEANMNIRQTKAREYYEQFKGMTAPTYGADGRIGTIKLTGDNAIKMSQMLTEAIRIADDDRYTYSQTNRDSEFQYDCSSLVYRLYLKYFNIQVPGDTASYGSAYYIGTPTTVELQPGDVLWRSGHVEIYLGNNLRVGAHTDKVAIPDQISVKSYSPPGSFTKVYRFIQ